MLTRTCRICNRYKLVGRAAQIGWICSDCDIKELTESVRNDGARYNNFASLVASLAAMTAEELEAKIQKELYQ